MYQSPYGMGGQDPQMEQPYGYDDGLAAGGDAQRRYEAIVKQFEDYIRRGQQQSSGGGGGGGLMSMFGGGGSGGGGGMGSAGG